MRNPILKTEEQKIIENSFTLINGEFTPKDAREILNHLIMEKINFHDRKNLSSQIRYGYKDENSIIRVNQLKKGKLVANETIMEAENKNRKVRITSNITIEII